jgi:hypothetical protein
MKFARIALIVIDLVTLVRVCWAQQLKYGVVDPA